VAGLAPEARLELRYTDIVMAGHQREARLRPDDPAIHDEKKRRPGAIPAFFYRAGARFTSPRLRGEVGA